jgi:hypothetical protein
MFEALLFRFLGLLEAEKDVPVAAYAIVGCIGACVVWAVFGRTLISGSRTRLAPALFAASTSIVLGLAMVMSLGYQTSFFLTNDLREVGTAQQRVPVMPEAAVNAARGILDDNDTWSLSTPLGRCGADEYRFFWLAFRLFPNIPDCRSADIQIFFAVSAPSDRKVVNAGDGWQIVRP